MAKEALKKRIDKNIKTEFDSVIFYTTMTLVFIGIIMVFSASLFNLPLSTMILIIF